MSTTHPVRCLKSVPSHVPVLDPPGLTTGVGVGSTGSHQNGGRCHALRGASKEEARGKRKRRDGGREDENAEIEERVKGGERGERGE
eukprot:754043-Hanusia_phi.AAC.2